MKPNPMNANPSSTGASGFVGAAQHFQNGHINQSDMCSSPLSVPRGIEKLVLWGMGVGRGDVWVRLSIVVYEAVRESIDRRAR